MLKPSARQPARAALKKMCSLAHHRLPRGVIKHNPGISKASFASPYN
jgi:hypothetical protein